MVDWAAYRIAPLLDEHVFRLPEDAPRLTKDGKPWVRWANACGDYSGYYALGTRPPELVDEPSDVFWHFVVGLASEVGNGMADAVHCVGPGVLSIGGMGVTLSSGYAQVLLGYCLEELPLHWVHAMMPVLRTSGVCVGLSDAGLRGWSLVAPELREAIATAEQLDRAVRGGSNGTQWHAVQKYRAKTWVSCVSEMLSHPGMDAAQARFCRAYVPQLMPSEARERISWPTNGIQDGWMFTDEQRALWACAMVLFIEDEQQATRLVMEHVQTEPIDAKASLRNLRDAAPDPKWTDTFRGRISNTVSRVQELFKFQV